MAVAIEAFCVIGNRRSIEDCDFLSLDDLNALTPNATSFGDDWLWRCSFMAESDAGAFVARLEQAGFNVSHGPDSHFVIVNEFDLEVAPYCEWLEVAQYEKGVIAWKVGSEPDTIVARSGWTPKTGSGLTFSDRRQMMENLEFVRLEGDNVEVFRDKTTGELVYIGRTETPVEALFETSAKYILQHSLKPGQPPVRGPVKTKLKNAVHNLQCVAQNHPDFWRAHYFIGKGWEAVGETENAYPALCSAYQINPNEKNVCRALCAVCIGSNRTSEALNVAIKEATLFPDDHQTLGNLALCYLLDQQITPALKTIDAAITIGPEDQVNLNLRDVIDDVVANRRSCPVTMKEIGGTLQQPWWKRWLGWMPHCRSNPPIHG